jgi:IclR family transcriptional regulator, KDG regulon repressor
MRVIESFYRGLRMLDFIVEHPEGVKPVQVAREFHMPSSNVVLFLQSLVKAGYVIKSPIDSKYYLSNKIGSIVARGEMDPFRELKFSACPEMDRLYREYNENLLLAVINVRQLEFLHKMQSTRGVQIINRPRAAFLPHATAAGKAVLAFWNGKRLNQYLKEILNRKFTRKTLSSRNEITQELEEVRRVGYAINRGEYEEEIMAVAAPIFQGSEVIAALAMQLPAARYQEADLHVHADAIVTASKRISRALKGIGSG